MPNARSESKASASCFAAYDFDGDTQFLICYRKYRFRYEIRNLIVLLRLL